MTKQKPTIEIITDRRTLIVREPYLRGGHALVDVDVCTKCAAIVFDPIAHDRWHRSGDPS